MSQSNRVRFVLVDDHAIARLALRHLIVRQSGWEVVGEASGRADALAVIRDKQPDIAIIDLFLGDGSGLDLIKEARVYLPALRLLVVSGADEFMYAERAVRAGARGFVSKSEPLPVVVTAIHNVLDGRVWLSEAMTAAILARASGRYPGIGAGPLELLSDRELEVYELLGRGRGIKEIAASLNISPKTVEYHREHIKQKMNLPNSAAVLRRATAWVIESGGGNGDQGK